MKKKFIIGLSAILCLILFITVIFFATNKNNNPSEEASQPDIATDNMGSEITVIDTEITYQTIEGFGVSSYIWANAIGEWENAEEIIDLLYSQDNGIGLDIYRYYLGAGSAGDTALDEAVRTESFMTKDKKTDFTKDTASRKCLEYAKKAAGENLQVTFYSDSPPVQLTQNGKSYASPQENSSQNVSNLPESSYKAYAEYLYSVCEFFVNSGYRVTGISPVNEPQYSRKAVYDSDAAVSARQESCYYSPDELRNLLTAVVTKFNKSELHNNGVYVTMFESGEAEGENSETAEYLNTILSADKKNKLLRDYFNRVTVHSYWSSAEEKINFATLIKEKYPSCKIDCTQYCQKTNDGNGGVLEYIVNEGSETKGLSVEYGLAMANIIITDLTEMNAVSWSWHKACSFENAPDGLIYIDKENHESITASKRLWCLGNFSKFVNEGAQRLAFSSGNEALTGVCFINTDDSIVCIYLNRTENEEITSLAQYATQNTCAYITDSEHNLEKSQLINDGTVTIPAMSLVTVIIK